MNKIRIGGVVLTVNKKQIKSLQHQLSVILGEPNPHIIKEPGKPKEPEVLRVPNNIRIGSIAIQSGQLGIINLDRKELFYNDLYDGWAVSACGIESDNKYILNIIAKDDLRAGDLFFSTDANSPEFTDMYGYRIYLGNGMYVFWNRDGGVSISRMPFKFYYKVTTDAKPL